MNFHLEPESPFIIQEACGCLNKDECFNVCDKSVLSTRYCFVCMRHFFVEIISALLDVCFNDKYVRNNPNSKFTPKYLKNYSCGQRCGWYLLSLHLTEPFTFDFYCILLYNFAYKLRRQNPIYDPTFKQIYTYKVTLTSEN